MKKKSKKNDVYFSGNGVCSFAETTRSFFLNSEISLSVIFNYFHNSLCINHHHSLVACLFVRKAPAFTAELTFSILLLS